MDTTQMILASLSARRGRSAAPAAAQPARAMVMPAMRSARSPRSPAMPAFPGWRESADDRADDLYDRARDLIEQGKFDRAVADLDRLIALKSNRTDAAMYWKAYSLAKLGQRADALTHARRSDQAVQRQPLAARRQGARGRSPAGLRAGRLARLAGR